MKIIRVRNSIGVDYMRDHMVDDDLSLDIQVQAAKEFLIRDPDNILILQAWEGDTLMSFLYAYNVVDSPYVFIYQAWADPKFPSEEADKMFFKLLFWAESLGKREVRMETIRDEAFSRKWKFQKISTVMSFKLYDGYETDMVKNLKNENDIPQEGISGEVKDG